jgi:cytochrome c peroxidase
MATIKMLVPAAFNSTSTEPDVAALTAVTGTTADAVNTLIELQLFHLGRARDITSQMRARIAQRREMAQQHMQSLVTCSSGSSCDDESLVQSLE